MSWYLSVRVGVLPIQRYRNGTQPCSDHGADHSAVCFVNRKKQRNDISPLLSLKTMDIYQRKSAEEGDVRAAQQRVQVVGGCGSTEENEDCCEQWGDGERADEEAQNNRLHIVSFHASLKENATTQHITLDIQ